MAVQNPSQLNLTVTLASIPDVSGGRRVIPITADSDTRFTEVLQNLTDQGIIKPVDDQHEYVFKRVASNQIINNPDTSLQQAGVKENEDLKLFVREKWA
jgi:threonyl-tRNA synthetase